MPLTLPRPGDGRRQQSPRLLRGIAVVVVIVALLWLITDRLLVGFLPLRWGGPNIGGGMLILLCYAAIIGGFMGFAATGGLAVRRWTARTWAVATLITVLLAGYLGVVIVQPRDEEAGIVGRTGVTVDAQGEPIAVLMVCRGVVDQLTVHGPNRGDQPNEQLAAYRSTQPLSGYHELDLLDPGPNWTPQPGLTREVIEGQRLVIVSVSGEKAALTGVSFTSDDLKTLTSGVVLDGTGQWCHRRTADEFRAASCPAR